MAKGAEAKEYVARKLKEAFGEDYVGEVDKKYYVWSRENGQRMQIAIAMTCPKVPVGEVPAESGDFDWEGSSVTNEPVTKHNPVEIDDAERARVAELMKKLGL